MILQVFDAAKIELREAVAYHNEQLMGLGDQFLQEVEQIFAQIEEGPFRFGKMETLRRRTDVRRALVPRFPYYVPFQIVGDEILVVAVAHGSRKPNYWRGRLKP